MHTIGFIDLAPSIHHTRISNFLSKDFIVESIFISLGLSDINTYNLDAVLIGEIDKTVNLVKELNLPKIGISWSRDIQRLSNQPANSIIQDLLKLDLILVDCNYHMQNLIRLGIQSNRMLKFPYGVNLSRYDFLEKPYKNSDFVVYSNRSWEPGYGYETLLEAIERYADYSRTVRFRVAGDGSLRIGLLKKYKSLLNSGQLVFLGNISEDDNIEELKKSDLFISASEYDGISVSILESMAIGTPVIVSDIPPNLEIISNGQNGLFFCSQKSDDLFLKIKDILGSNQKRSQFAIKSRRLVETNANWTVNMNTFKDKILTLLGH
jgi:glycosyltransferase involved in cell wall biosynthesis